jgi:hypothetical protein
MGSQLEATGPGVHYLHVAGGHVDCYGEGTPCISVECTDRTTRSVDVVVTARLPRLEGGLRAKMHRTGFCSDGKRSVDDFRPLKVEARTVALEEVESLVPALVAVAQTTPRVKRRRMVKRAEKQLAWKTQFSFTVRARDFFESDRAIMRNANGDTSALYHTGFRVVIDTQCSIKGTRFPVTCNVYCRAPISIPFSPVACPLRARDAIRCFSGTRVVPSKESEGSLAIVQMKVLHDMSVSGDRLHRAVAKAIYDHALLGFVADGSPVALVPSRADIFNIVGVQAYSVAETFIAFSLISQLPLGFTIFNGEARDLSYPTWGRISFDGRIRVVTTEPAPFHLGPRLELKPSFVDATHPRNMRRYWCHPEFAPRLTSLRRRLDGF